LKLNFFILTTVVYDVDN